MSIKIRIVRWSLLLVFTAFTQIVSAEPAARTTVEQNGDYGYRFSDEDLLGNSLSNVGDMYKGRPKYARVLLLRPRTSLVNELLKSAEDL